MVKNKGAQYSVVLALLSLYFVWGSTYLGIRIALEGFPPFLMAGLRNVIAGMILYVFMRLQGTPIPRLQELKGGSIVGAFLLLGGNGGVVFAEQWVASGIAALVIATTSLCLRG